MKHRHNINMIAKRRPNTQREIDTEFVCPNGHDVIDKDKSTEFVTATINPCPTCKTPLIFILKAKQ